MIFIKPVFIGFFAVKKFYTEVKKFMDSNLTDKVKKSVERLRVFEPEEGYFLAYSGGKDSDTVKILAYLADVKFEAVHNLTSVDAPETMNYIKSQKDVRIEKPRYEDGRQITMWNLIVKKGSPPLRISRYCCSDLKECGGKGRVVVTGVRWSEGTRRKEHSDLIQFMGKPKTTQKLAEEIGVDYRVTNQGGIILNNDNDESRRMVETCYRTRKTTLNPIIDWSDDEVWEFLKHYDCKSNTLYECGFKRIGCIGCPMARKNGREKEFERYPVYKNNYIKAFNRMIEMRKEQGKRVDEKWTSGEAVFEWWIKG